MYSGEIDTSRGFQLQYGAHWQKQWKMAAEHGGIFCLLCEASAQTVAHYAGLFPCGWPEVLDSFSLRSSNILETPTKQELDFRMRKVFPKKMMDSLTFVAQGQPIGETTRKLVVQVVVSDVPARHLLLMRSWSGACGVQCRLERSARVSEDLFATFFV